MECLSSLHQVCDTKNSLSLVLEIQQWCAKCQRCQEAQKTPNCAHSGEHPKGLDSHPEGQVLDSGFLGKHHLNFQKLSPCHSEEGFDFLKACTQICATPLDPRIKGLPHVSL